VAATKIAKRPIAERDTLQRHVKDAADPMFIGRVGAFRAREAIGPGREELADRLGAVIRKLYEVYVATDASLTEISGLFGRFDRDPPAYRTAACRTPRTRLPG